MPWRLVGSFLVFAVFLVFILSNLGNNCDISFIKWTMPNIPVFVTVFASFALGMICSIPLIISAHIKGKKKGGSDKPLKKDTQKPGEALEDQPTLDEGH